MEIKSTFDHFNINVSNLDASIAFYAKALGLKKVSEKRHPEGKFILTYLSDSTSNFLLELTWLADHEGISYDLGENESHLAVRVDGDYDEIKEFHREMGVICYENEEMGLYFIHDPDDYWIEILRKEK